ncbi:hypothetical protein [Spirosoma aerolatum]|uniref:hypothetical protein n=1 Tax=Spirosoma aerolatum TaxID=1211326 RepID=UPI0009ADCD56|nr:hypothetical protein [Spirosoma aerolatum]
MIYHFPTLRITCLAFAVGLVLSCSTSDSNVTTASGSYSGTGSVTQGKATTTTTNLFSLGLRIAALGSITSTDNKTWAVPADVNYSTSSFPFASDLFNSYVSGHSYANTASAVSALSSNSVVTVDSDGDTYTAYIFADNYFEMYVNGTPVGKDPVPYTDFNSCILRFKAKKPFTVAVKCVDWEENLGLGTEANNGNSYHAGDGGFVAVIKDKNNSVVAITDGNWKAQTYYIAPISDLSCLSESGNYRYSTNCSTSSGSASNYGIHWAVPTNWYASSYDDSGWPAAATFTNTTVGVDNKPSYQNFTDMFDASGNDASFIWSSNLVLDNLVLLRKTVN